MKKSLFKTIFTAMLAVMLAFAFAACENGVEPANGTPGKVASFAAAAGDGQVTLNWTAPADDGGYAVTGYEVTRDNFSSKVTKPATELTHTFTGLTNGTLYTFKIRAVNEKGAGEEASLTARPQDADEPIGDGEEFSAWPAARIAELIGGGLPDYTGEGTLYTLTTETTELNTSVTVLISGGTLAGAAGYISALTSNGYQFQEDTEGYRKNIGGGVYFTVYVSENEGDVLVYALKSGDNAYLSPWPANELAAALSGTGVTLPEYDGASGFSYSNEAWIQIIAYEATSGLEAYRTKLKNAAFTEDDENRFIKNTQNNKIITVDLSDQDALFPGQVLIIVTLAEKPVVPQTHYTMPENLMVRVSEMGGVYKRTVIKVGDEYYAIGGSLGTTAYFLAHDDGEWTKWLKYGSDPWEVNEDGIGAYDLDAALYSFYADMTEENDFSAMTKQADAVVCGREVETYLDPGNEYTIYLFTSRMLYVDKETRLILKITFEGSPYGTALDWEIDQWDTAITGFDGITLPQ